jgi:predicted acetylornithine/succinylornithine family transaminase
MMRTEDIRSLYEKYVLGTYSYEGICLIKGSGARVEDSEGKKYLDFFPGWAVSGIGHCHPRVVNRIREQAGRILHVSNNYYNELQGQLARRIIEASFPGKVFFANSGAEANEAAIKLARRFGDPGRYEIITMERSFHGRTLATLTATGQEKVKKGFSPLPEGFRHVPFNDIGALMSALNEKTAAVMLEPVQGEGGINVAEAEYIAELADICRNRGILLIFDEVQTGMGRTGKMFAYQHYGVEPDAMTLAKSLGGGMPIGALVVANEHCGVLSAGSHASTFGGSPIACSAALGVFEAIESEGLMDNCLSMSEYLRSSLSRLGSDTGRINEIRGLGLMLGVRLSEENGAEVASACAEKGLLINCTQKNILRIMPPLTVRTEEIDEAMDILKSVLEKR